MRHFVITLLFVLTGLTLQAQQNQPVEPKGSISKLGLRYFSIDFTKAQRAMLDTVDLELIFDVDANGYATMSKVNGIDDKAIIDSLETRTKGAQLFEPEVMDGKKIPSLYFMTLRFPSYNTKQQFSPYTYYSRLNLEDIENVQYGGGMDLLIGAVMNTYAGNAQDYLKTGGGMKLDLLFTTPKGLGFGIDMVLFGNKLKQPYPISSTRTQNLAPPTMLIGIAMSKRWMEFKKSDLSAQLELNYVLQNITPKLDNTDHDWTQFSGFSPGVVINYSMRFGKEKIADYYAKPSLLTNGINIHAAVRPLFYKESMASGISFELGLSYRMRLKSITSYDLK